MTRFARNPQTVEARQWDGTLADAERLCVWAKGRWANAETSYSRDSVSGNPLHVLIKTPPEAKINLSVIIHAGDYLLWIDGTAFSWASAAEFTREYTEIDAHQKMG